MTNQPTEAEKMRERVSKALMGLVDKATEHSETKTYIHFDDVIDGMVEYISKNYQLRSESVSKEEVRAIIPKRTLRALSDKIDKSGGQLELENETACEVVYEFYEALRETADLLSDNAPNNNPTDK